MKSGFRTLCGIALEVGAFPWHSQRLTTPKKFPEDFNESARHSRPGTASPPGLASLAGPAGTASLASRAGVVTIASLP